ncbi:Uncharacterised protein [Mycobacteroides abscessus subsp. abscessus]|nr:Uncharacterised protein [Mycobacteroides abscessus subsp. abscessus]
MLATAPTKWNPTTHTETGPNNGGGPRKYRTGKSQAVTKWVPFNPNAKSNGYGKARTYYGR